MTSTPMRCAPLVLLAACAPWPTSEAQLPRSSKDVWLLLIHGAGENADRWVGPLRERLEARVTMKERVEMVSYDWREAARDRLSADGRGEAEGRALGRALLERRPTHVHVIAHSAGAWVAFGLESELAAAPARPALHLTLLDPFLGRGLDFGFGASRFATRADFADGYLHRGDGAPGTEQAVDAAHTFDVTEMASKPAFRGSEGHFWPPTVYPDLEPGFGLSLEAAGTFDPAALRARFPPGATTRVP